MAASGSFTPARSPLQRPVRRRANREQGRALEVLAHAIEYLVDSRLFLIDQPPTAADGMATSILMQASRNVFQECMPCVGTSERIRNWMSRRFTDRQTDVTVA